MVQKIITFCNLIEHARYLLLFCQVAAAVRHYVIVRKLCHKAAKIREAPVVFVQHSTGRCSVRRNKSPMHIREAGYIIMILSTTAVIIISFFRVRASA